MIIYYFLNLKPCCIAVNISIQPCTNLFNNESRISVRNENGYFHGDGPIKAEKEHEEQMLSLKNMRNAMEVEHGKRDRMDVTKVNFLDIYFGQNIQIDTHRYIVNSSCV